MSTSSSTPAGVPGTGPAAPAAAAAPRATQVETHGIDTIPATDRSARPLDLFRIQFGGANTFATIILGTFPVVLGLSCGRPWPRRSPAWSSAR
jgi:hypothetical protein